MGREFLN